MSTQLKANDCLLAVVDGSRIRFKSKFSESINYIAAALDISTADVDLRPVGRQYHEACDGYSSFVDKDGDLSLDRLCGDDGLTPYQAAEVVSDLQQVLEELTDAKLRDAAQQWVDDFNA